MRMNKLVIAFVVVSFGFLGCMSNPYTNQPFELDSEEAREAASYYKSIIALYKQNGLLLTDTELGQQVVEVANNLIAAAQKWELVNNDGKNFVLWHKESWEVNFVGDPEWNASCMAGGKICVKAGLFYGPAAIQTDDELAAVIGHEIAHALLFHIKRDKDYEKQRSEWGFGDDKRTAYSRATETEADKVGLTLMILAGYDGNAAADIWEKMATTRGYYDEFNASHPADLRRAKNLRKEIPQSQKIARKINQGEKAVQFVAPTLSVSAGANNGANPKISLETTRLGLSLYMQNEMEDWLGSVYLKHNFRFGTSAENILSPFAGIEFSNGYFGYTGGANIDIKLIARLYLRGQIGLRWSSNMEDFPMFPLGLGAVWAIK